MSLRLILQLANQYHSLTPMRHLKLKSLTFYGVALGLVLLLFKVVTAYGESNLKASPAIGDRYRLAISEDLPICNQSNSFLLDIQQSGVYVNAFLLPISAASQPLSQAIPSLTGKLNQRQVNLSGKIPRAILCYVKNAQKQNLVLTRDNLLSIVRMEMIITKDGHLSGEMNVSGTSRNVKFIAIPQKSNKQLNNH